MAVIAVLVNFAGFPALFFFQIVFLLESARSNNSMSVGICAVVDIGLANILRSISERIFRDMH